MGGGPCAPPVFFRSEAFQIDLKDPRIDGQFLFCIDNGSPEAREPKGCTKKFQSIIFEAGVKNQNFKLDPIALKFCMGL